MNQKIDDLGSDFERVAALMSELEMTRMQFDEKENGYKEKIKRLEGQLTEVQGRLRVATDASPVSLVEYQAMRQELEGLRRTAKELQGQLEGANEHSQNAEDQLEDKNDKIERLNQEIDMLRGDMEEAEYKRRESEEARAEQSRKIYQLQEELEKVAAREALAAERQQGEPKEAGAGKGLLMGLVGGVLLMLGGLEGISLSTGKGELITHLYAPAPSTDRGGMAEKVLPKESSFTPTPPVRVDATPQVAKQAPAATDIPVEATAPSSVDRPEVKPEAIEATTPVVPDKVEAVAEKTPAPTTQSEPQEVMDNANGIPLMQLPGGSFAMGSRSGLERDEAPVHEVTLKPFLISRHEVTFDQYDRFAKATGRELPNDSGWGRGNRPVINVSWQDAQAYVRWLSETSGQRYRLPTEAEWEYAAAAGSHSPFWWGYQAEPKRANCFNCGNEWDGRSTSPIDSFQPNGFGLYDTAGNVSEWVQDCYKANYQGVPADGGAVELQGCGERVARGGAFNKPAVSMRTTKRSRFPENTKVNSLGFRVVREP